MSARRLFVDTTALQRFSEFRRLLIGFSLSQLGAQFGVVAIAFQVYRLTHSDFDVGLVSFVQIVPILFASVLGGTLADTASRRAVLLVAEGTVVVSAAALALNASSSSPRLWLVYALAAMSAAAVSVDGPTRNSVLVTIVDRDALMSANSLRQLTQKVAVVAGPAAGGVLIGVLGVASVYVIESVSFTAAMVSALGVARRPPASVTGRFGARTMLETFSWFRRQQAVRGCFYADLNAMVLGMPTALFPAIGVVRFHGGAGKVGLLYAAPGAGALVVSIFSGWTGEVRRPGRAACLAIVLWGFAIAAFGFSGSLPMALVLLAIVGGADVISVLFLGMIIQIETPEALRGRILALQSGVLGNGPRLGAMESGLVAGLGGVELAVVTGGIGCVLGIFLIARWMPALVDYRLPPRRLLEEGSACPTPGGPESPVGSPRRIPDLLSDELDNQQGG